MVTSKLISDSPPSRSRALRGLKLDAVRSGPVPELTLRLSSALFLQIELPLGTRPGHRLPLPVLSLFFPIALRFKFLITTVFSSGLLSCLAGCKGVGGWRSYLSVSYLAKELSLPKVLLPYHLFYYRNRQNSQRCIAAITAQCACYSIWKDHSLFFFWHRVSLVVLYAISARIASSSGSLCFLRLR